MRFCNRCHKFTVGEPVFCNFCGSTYDVKLCSRQHPNPRYAKICSQCGSREMSTPQPRIPILFRPVLAVVVVLPRLLCVVFTIGGAALILHWLATDREGQQSVLLLILVALPPFLIWRWLPPSAQKITRGAFSLFIKLCSSPRKGKGRQP